VRVCRVRPDVPAIRRAFDYLVPASLADAVHQGVQVRVELHGRRVHGWVVDADVAAPDAAPDVRLRPLLAVSSAGPPPEVLALCEWAAWRWAGPVVTFLRASSPANHVDVGLVVEPEHAVYPRGGAPDGDALVLTAPATDPPVAQLLASEGSTIVVDPVPERAARRARDLADAGRVVWEWGSANSAAARTEAWAGARAGACVVIGGRTAVWAPVPDLAAVVVLDDTDEALEDERAPTWNARDVAVERARRVGAAVRIATPAPTVEALEVLGAPVAGSAPRWPRFTVVDPRDEEPGQWLLTAALADALRRVGGAGGWSVCVLNRRGRARLLACVACGELARCEQCGATVLEVDTGTGATRLVCPQCDTARPNVCLACHGARFRAVKPGVTKVRDDLAALVPRASVVAVDAATGDDAALRTADVLVGTEAVLHRAMSLAVGAGNRGRPGLVAFLELDQELLAPRARAAEQALWLLVRAARLVGSRRDGGEVLVQTRLREHEVVRAATGSDPLLVTDAEAARRRILGHPPFGGLAELSGDPGAVGAACDALRELTVAAQGVNVLGPIDDGKRALVRAPTVTVLCDALAAPAIDAARALGRLRVDVDPRRAGLLPNLRRSAGQIPAASGRKFGGKGGW
jgi:primosomal protein N' (replication factor Y)